MGRRCALLILAFVWPASAQAATQQVIAARDVPSAMAVDRDGTAYLVTSQRRAVALRRAAPGAPFGRSRTLAREHTVDAAVASDGSGAIVRRRGRSVEVATFDAGGGVRPWRNLSRGRTADFAALAVARGGVVIVVWFRHIRAGRWRLEAALRAPGAPAFAAPESLSRFARRACCTHVAVAVGERGDAVVAWRSTFRPAVRAALRPGGGRFQRAQRLAPEASDDPVAAIGPNGTAVVMYSLQRVPTRSNDGLRLHRAETAAGFGDAEVVNPGGGVTFGDAVVTPAGRLVVAWVDPAAALVGVTESGPGEALAERVIGTGVAPRPPVVAASDDGSAVVAWSRQSSDGRPYAEQVVASTRAAHDAQFQPAIPAGPAWRSAQPRAVGLVVGGALMTWSGAEFDPGRRPAGVLAATRLP